MSDNNKEAAATTIRNAELFKTIMMSFVDDIASGISQEEFRSILTTLEGKSSTANMLYDMQKSAIVNEVHQDIDYMFRTSEIDKKYTEVTKLIQQSPEDYRAWRPTTGDCNAQLHSYRLQALIDKKEKLQNLVKKERILRNLLKNDLDQKRNLIKDHLIKISTAKADLSKYNNSLLRRTELNENV